MAECFGALDPAIGVVGVVELFLDMDLVRCDAHYRALNGQIVGSILQRGKQLTVFLVHSLDLILERAHSPCRKIDLVESRYGSQTRPRESAELMDMKTIDDHHEGIGQDTAQQKAGTHGHFEEHRSQRPWEGIDKREREV